MEGSKRSEHLRQPRERVDLDKVSEETQNRIVKELDAGTAAYKLERARAEAARRRAAHPMTQPPWALVNHS
jgi:hypothetical protein